MLINEIFASINGESIFAGYPTIFIRTYGCNIRCNYCDTLHACEGNEFTEMSVSDIVEEVSKYELDRVTLTGGEPLLQKDSADLILALVDRGYNVEIETNGAVDLKPFMENLGDIPRITFTMDWKCKGSGMQGSMIESNLSLLRPDKDVIKFVVSDEYDLDEMKSILPKTQAIPFVSPVFGRIRPKDIPEYIVSNNLTRCRCQIQIHKVIYPVDMRGV